MIARPRIGWAYTSCGCPLAGRAVTSGFFFEFSLILLQLPLAPMRLFAIGESALDAMMHRPEHPDARMQQRAAILCSHDQRLYSGLPVR